MTLRGVDVGQVADRKLLPDYRVVLSLELRRGIPVPADSRIELGSKSIFGEPDVRILPGSSTGRVRSGDTLIAGVEPPPTDRLEELSGRATDVLNPAFIQDLHATTREFRESARSLGELLNTTTPHVERLARSLSRSAQGLERVAAGPDLEATAQSMAMASEQLRLMGEGLSGSARRLEAILAKVDAGEGSLGRLVNDPGLYEDLRGLVSSYRALAEDIRENPKRYVNVSVF